MLEHIGVCLAGAHDETTVNRRGNMSMMGLYPVCVKVQVRSQASSSLSRKFASV